MSSAESSPGVLARTVSGKRSKWAILAVWLIALIGLAGFAGKFNDVQKNDSGAWLPKSAESTKELALEAKFHPTYFPALVVFARPGGLTDADNALIDQVKTAVTSGGKAYSQVVPSSVQLIRPAAGSPHADEAAELLVPIDPGTAGWNTLPDDVKAIKTAMGTVPAGLETHITGIAGIAADESQSFKNINGALSYITVSVVILILLLAYRSPILWLMPILSAVFAVTVAQAVIYLLAKHAGLTVNAQGAFILYVLVIGAGTDYALLIVARYREELRNYQDRHEAMAHALHRAGPAVVASSATVAFSMLVLLLAEMNSTKGMGPVLAIGVIVALIAMLSLLPALLVIIGGDVRRLFNRGRATSEGRWLFWPARPEFGSPEPTASGVWARVGQRIKPRPRAVWIVTAVILAAFAAGVAKLDAHPLSTADQFTSKPDSIVGLTTQARYFPAASGQPITVIANADKADQVKAAMAVQGIDAASIGTPPGTKPVVDGLAYLEGTPTDAADSPAAKDTVNRVRDAVHQVAGANALVGGGTAISLDTNLANSHDSKVIIPSILLVVFVILALLLRALLAPLLLIGTVIVSFGASLGISSLMFHAFGWNGVDTSLPLYAFVFLVALGIDYNIFLMTRIREESVRQGTRPGALTGLSATGGVITWAGLVLAATFGVLATMPIVPFAEIGFSVSLGVLLDTMIVRSILVTSLTLDIGKKMWWPGALSKREEPAYGDVDVQGSEASVTAAI